MHAIPTHPLQIGITGGIGCGKSIVSRIFSILGVPVYDADSRAKWLMASDTALKDRIISTFGPETYLADGRQNRFYFASEIFTDASKVQQLNQLVHPRVREDYQQWTSRQQTPYILREAALLFEAGVHADTHAVIVVTAPLSLRLQRIRQRDPHRTEADIQAIMDKQMPEEEKIRRADYLIQNDESQLVVPKVLELDRLFRAK